MKDTIYNNIFRDFISNGLTDIMILVSELQQFSNDELRQED